MTLEQISYLGELIAALSVIGSLVYVARRVGQDASQCSYSQQRRSVPLECDAGRPRYRLFVEILVKCL